MRSNCLIEMIYSEQLLFQVFRQNVILDKGKPSKHKTHFVNYYFIYLMKKVIKHPFQHCIWHVFKETIAFEHLSSL
uniref:Uncharacterized protein n=1 Tax=Anguilla anguilla TaxID=7936 RepID=A0A0E9Q4I8_ANGAN